MRFNENNEVIDKESYRAILVGLSISNDISYSMEELERLAAAADIEVAGHMVQHLKRPNNATFIGKGKVAELASMCEIMEADTAVFNDELSGVQLRNLEELLNIRVIDRTILILDIFAARAISGEGKLQVELAQLQYRLPRLTGFGNALSRLGGGIGTRGPGEKKLETDRRHISKRMDEIKSEILRIKGARNSQRLKREKSEIPVAALVGYTNSGKSAIMNRLLEMTDKTEKAVFEADMLFATLDIYQRGIKLDNNNEFVLIDTVGFVSKLPHHLVNAFKATLEEVKYADLLIHIVDSAYENHDFQIEVTDHVLKEIGAGGKEKIMVYNKADLLAGDVSADNAGSLHVSAKTGYNMDLLLSKIKAKLFSDRVGAVFLIPYDQGGVSSYLCEKADVISMDYTENGTLFNVEVSAADYNRLKRYEQIQDGV